LSFHLLLSLHPIMLRTDAANSLSLTAVSVRDYEGRAV
jgi:hypothetical protein